MANRLIRDGALYLYGPVGFVDFFDDTGFTATDVLAALTELEGDIDVHINSGGGIAFDGVAIFNALKQYDGKVTAYVDAIAASAASIIAMAGDEIVMAEGAMMMIHDASGVTMGTAADHEKQAKVLDKLDNQIASIYAKRTSTDLASVRAAMDEETWMSGDEAISMRFATKLASANDNKPTAYDFRQYKHAPERLVAMADGWTSEGRFARRNYAASAAPRQEKEFSMSGTNEGGAKAPAMLTAETLKAENPALYAAIAAEGAKNERERIAGVEKAARPGHEKLIATLKFDGKTSPGDAALAVLDAMNAADAASNSRALKSLDADEEKVKDIRSEPSNSNTPAASGLVGEAKWKAEWAASAALQAEFNNSEKAYLAYRKGEDEGTVRILGKKLSAA